MAVRKHKLEYKEDFDFLLLGIASTENDYRLIWNINRHLNFGFEKTENHKIREKTEQQEQEFSHYTYENEDLFLLYRIIANRSEKGVLIDELKNIDYLFMIHGEITELSVKNLISDLKEIEHIQGIFRINPASLKSRERLLIL